MFGLDVIRHRLFESNLLLLQPSHPRHRGRVAGWRHGVKSDGPYLAVYGRGGDKGTVATRQRAMGCDWITDYDALAQAIPPAYTELVGAQLLDAVRSAA
jgi:DNA (cytosine-5)-methyltransferase 1